MLLVCVLPVCGGLTGFVRVGLAASTCRDSWSFCHGQKKYLSYATSFMQLMSWLAFAKNILLELLTADSCFSFASACASLVVRTDSFF